MSISILNRGASGGLKPELTVTAPSGSTIDLLQNGIIVATYTLGASETEHSFAVKLGTYTVRGTLGEKMGSEEVLIDAVGQYEVTIEYILWLYNEGDECEEVTGGWSKGVHSINDGLGTVTKQSNSILLKTTSTTADDCPAATVNKVDLTNYQKLCISFVNVSGTHGTNNQPVMRVVASSIRGLDDSSKYVSRAQCNFNGETSYVVSASLDEVNGEYYIVGGIYTSDAVPNTSAYIDRVWLE